MGKLNRHVLTPLRSIKIFCLNRCEQEGKGRRRIGSIRDVSECINYDCPLHDFRTGYNRKKRYNLSAKSKEDRIEKLERARERAKAAEQKVLEATRALDEFDVQSKERAKDIERRSKEKIDDIMRANERSLEVLKERREEKLRKITVAKMKYEESQEYVKAMEKKFNEELERGAW